MEAFRQIWSQLKATFTNLGRGKQITLVTLLLGSLAGFIFLITWSGQSEFQPLYSQLEPEDAGIILSKLKEQKMDYRIASNGTTILIPQQFIYETRMKLASEGLPQGSAIGFEIFNLHKTSTIREPFKESCPAPLIESGKSKVPESISCCPKNHCSWKMSNRRRLPWF
jgi:flagellar biosynthesis/type III secretory pathway M-ring protein FliF/YscJ